MDTPVKDILARCYADLAHVEAEIEELSRQIDPTKTSAELREILKNNHPSKEDLLPTMKQALVDMRRYLTERNIMTIPREMPDVIVSPMPTYRSAGGTEASRPHMVDWSFVRF